MVPEEMETNADGIKTSRDVPAEVKGTLSLRTEFSCGRDVSRWDDSHCCGYGVAKFVETQTKKEREQENWEVAERGGDPGYL